MGDFGKCSRTPPPFFPCSKSKGSARHTHTQISYLKINRSINLFRLCNKHMGVWHPPKFKMNLNPPDISLKARRIIVILHQCLRCMELEERLTGKRPLMLYLLYWFTFQKVGLEPLQQHSYQTLAFHLRVPAWWWAHHLGPQPMPLHTLWL